MATSSFNKKFNIKDEKEADSLIKCLKKSEKGSHKIISKSKTGNEETLKRILSRYEN